MGFALASPVPLPLASACEAPTGKGGRPGAGRHHDGAETYLPSARIDLLQLARGWLQRGQQTPTQGYGQQRGRGSLPAKIGKAGEGEKSGRRGQLPFLHHYRARPGTYGTGGRLIRNPPHYLHGWEGAAVGSIAFENSPRRCNDAMPLALSQEGLTGLLTNRPDQMPGDDVPTRHAAGECRPLADQLPFPMAAVRFV